MSSLYRREDDTVPSWPLLSITTGIASLLFVVVPRIPAMYVAPITPPMRIVSESPATPLLPIKMLLLSLDDKLPPAYAPTRILLLPLSIDWPAEAPIAVFEEPVVLLKSASNPSAVLREPVVL